MLMVCLRQLNMCAYIKIDRSGKIHIHINKQIVDHGLEYMVYRFRSVSNSFLVSCFNVHGWFEKIADRLQQKKENYDREEKKLLNQKTKWKNMIIRSIGEHKQSE